MALVTSGSDRGRRAAVIINADDFGITEGVNRAIYELVDAGVLSSTSAMANMPELCAVKGLKGRIGIGVHFNLTVGRPAAGPEVVPTLVDREENFLSLPMLLKRMKKGTISSSEVEAEAAAQIRRLEEAGIVPDHFDSHESLLKYPFFMRSLRKVAKSFGISAVRTYTPRVFDFSRLLSPRKTAISLYLELNKLGWKRGGFRVTHRSDSLLKFGLDYESAVLKLREVFQKPGPGTLELGVHPGYVEGEKAPLGDYVYEREIELKALMSDEFRAIRNSGIKLLNFNDIN